jgi:hypothetical protein
VRCTLQCGLEVVRLTCKAVADQLRYYRKLYAQHCNPDQEFWLGWIQSENFIDADHCKRWLTTLGLACPSFEVTLAVLDKLQQLADNETIVCPFLCICFASPCFICIYLVLVRPDTGRNEERTRASNRTVRLRRFHWIRGMEAVPRI